MRGGGVISNHFDYTTHRSIVGTRAFTPGSEASAAFALTAFIGHNTDVLILDELDCNIPRQFTPSQLNGILEGYLDTQVSKKHQVSQHLPLSTVEGHHNPNQLATYRHRHPVSCSGEGMQSLQGTYPLMA